METPWTFSCHAEERSSARSLPPGIVDLILTYGANCDAGAGTRKHALSKESLRRIKREFGREFCKTLAKYRRAYVVASAGRVITVAWRNNPLFH